MTFFDIYNRCWISATCRQWKNHDLEVMEGDNIVFEDHKKNHALVRRYYAGKLTFCKRQGCKYEKFKGPRQAWKIVDVIDGVEVPHES